MSGLISTTEEQQRPLKDYKALVDAFRQLALGNKEHKKAKKSVGIEHERFLFHPATYAPIPFAGEQGIEGIFNKLEQNFGWKPVVEKGKTIALTRDKANISLEPGCQFEFASSPHENIYDLRKELLQHKEELDSIAKEIPFRVMNAGFSPVWEVKDMPHPPKERYEIMRSYMPQVGSLGLHMMHVTCTTHVSLDYVDEGDMLRKFKLAMKIQPLLTALFANSPIGYGKLFENPSYASFRGHVWSDVDNQRSGFLPFVFKEDFTLEHYVRYLVDDVPMYFLKRGEDYMNVAGASFRAFLEGKLPGFEGQKPSMTDFLMHASCAFPEVRLREFFEMRGADCNNLETNLALAAFVVGIFYDADSLDGATAYLHSFSHKDIVAMKEEATKHALSSKTLFHGKTLCDVATFLLLMAKDGLENRGLDEEKFLTPLEIMLVHQKTNADRKREAYSTQGLTPQDKGKIIELFAD